MLAPRCTHVPPIGLMQCVRYNYPPLKGARPRDPHANMPLQRDSLIQGSILDPAELKVQFLTFQLFSIGHQLPELCGRPRLSTGLRYCTHLTKLTGLPRLDLHPVSSTSHVMCLYGHSYPVDSHPVAAPAQVCLVSSEKIWNHPDSNRHPPRCEHNCNKRCGRLLRQQTKIFNARTSVRACPANWPYVVCALQ